MGYANPAQFPFNNPNFNRAPYQVFPGEQQQASPWARPGSVEQQPAYYEQPQPQFQGNTYAYNTAPPQQYVPYGGDPSYAANNRPSRWTPNQKIGSAIMAVLAAGSVAIYGLYAASDDGGSRDQYSNSQINYAPNTETFEWAEQYGTERSIAALPKSLIYSGDFQNEPTEIKSEIAALGIMDINEFNQQPIERRLAWNDYVLQQMKGYIAQNYPIAVERQKIGLDDPIGDWRYPDFNLLTAGVQPNDNASQLVGYSDLVMAAVSVAYTDNGNGPVFDELTAQKLMSSLAYDPDSTKSGIPSRMLSSVRGNGAVLHAQPCQITAETGELSSDMYPDLGVSPVEPIRLTHCNSLDDGLKVEVTTVFRTFTRLTTGEAVTTPLAVTNEAIGNTLYHYQLPR